jgi:hypothetical protein
VVVVLLLLLGHDRGACTTLLLPVFDFAEACVEMASWCLLELNCWWLVIFDLVFRLLF